MFLTKILIKDVIHSGLSVLQLCFLFCFHLVSLLMYFHPSSKKLDIKVTAKIVLLDFRCGMSL